ncbi:hypothetical protein D3C85_1821370 [compost metagenome]
MVVDVSNVYIAIVIRSYSCIGYEIKLSYSPLTIQETSDSGTGESTYGSGVSSFFQCIQFPFTR